MANFSVMMPAVTDRRASCDVDIMLRGKGKGNTTLTVVEEGLQ
jgi:hypothetical protein